MHNKATRHRGQLAGRVWGRALSSLDGVAAFPCPSRTVPGPAHSHTFSLALAGLAQKPVAEHADNLPGHAGTLQWCHCIPSITSGQHRHSAVIKQEEPKQECFLKLKVTPGFLAERPGAAPMEKPAGKRDKQKGHCSLSLPKSPKGYKVGKSCLCALLCVFSFLFAPYPRTVSNPKSYSI